jgi:hypothetical protein
VLDDEQARSGQLADPEQQRPERFGLSLAMPDDGSSNKITFGSRAIWHARSTIRRLPVESSETIGREGVEPHHPTSLISAPRPRARLAHALKVRRRHRALDPEVAVEGNHDGLVHGQRAGRAG